MGAEKVGSIFYDLDLDDSKFKRGAKSASGEVNNLKKRFHDAEKGSFALAGALGVIGIAAVAFAKSSIQTAADIETMTQGFVTLLGSSEKANEAIALIKKDAAETPFELPGLIQANQLLTAVTKDAPRSERMLLNVGKALAAMGKGQPELDRIIVNLQQVGAVGKASAMDIKQFAFAGIPIFELLAEKTGLSGEALQDFISEGKVSFEVLEELFNDAGEGAGRFATAFETQAGTFNQLVGNMKDNLLIFGSELVKEIGLFDLAKKVVAKVNDTFGILSEKFEEAGGVLNFLKQTFKENQTVILAIAGAITVALLPALAAVITSFVALVAPLIPFLAIGAAIGFIVSKLVEKFGGWSAILEKIRPAIDFLRGALTMLVTGDFNKKISEMMGGIAEDSPIVAKIIGFRNIIVDVFSKIKKAVDFLKGALKLLITGDFNRGISQMMGGVYEDSPIVGKIIGFRDKIIEIFVKVKSAIRTLADAVGPFLEKLVGLKDKFIDFVNSPAVQKFLQIIRDSIVNGIQNLRKALEIIKPKIGELIKKFQEFWVKVQPLVKILLIVVGIIIGVLIIAIFKLVEVFTAVLGPALGLIIDVFGFLLDVIGDVINFFIKKVIPSFIKTWTAIAAIITWAWEKKISPVINFLVKGFTRAFKAIKFIWENILRPVVKLIQAIVLRVFKFIVDSVIRRFNILKSRVQIVWLAIKKFIIEPIKSAWLKVKEFVSKIFQRVRDDFNKTKTFLIGLKDAIVGAIVGPFEEAKKQIEAVGSGIQEVADKINPFHKESPSLVERVKMGTEKISDLYEKMFNSLEGISKQGRLNLIGTADVLNQNVQGPATQPVAQRPISLTLAPQGIIARSRGEMREIAVDMLDMANEELRARGLDEVQTSKIKGATP